MTAAPPPAPGADRTGGPAVDWVAVPPGTPGAWPPAGGWSAGYGTPPPFAPSRALGGPQPVPTSRPADGGGRRTLLVGLAGAVVGAALALVVAAALFAVAADRMGESIGEEVGDRVAESLGTGGGVWADDPLLPTPGGGPVEQTEPELPGDLGPDPVLDAYAQQCFDGDLQSCDDLFFSATPSSDYETYGLSCGGRVEPGAVYACTELD